MDTAPPLRSALGRAGLSGAAVLALLPLLMGASGCASEGLRSVDRSDLAHQLHARGIDPATIILPYELTPEMKQWVHTAVSQGMPPEERLKTLLQALLDTRKLNLTYEGHFTGTAAEAFASHHANCLAFTNLFVGMARELGVSVFYLDVDDIQKFERDGDLVVVSGHVSAGFGAGRELKILDFSAAPAATYRSIRPIQDETAIALYYSNRGGELLRAGQQTAALGWLRTAVALDPDLARAWINYGVALRRTGDLSGAEAAYRRALTIDPEAVSAYQNLASLLRVRGRAQEADELLALTGRLATRNPFNLLNLGDLSLAHGRLDEARGFYKRALRLYSENAEPYAALGLWAKAAGNPREARKWYKKAVARDANNERVRILAAQLGEALPPVPPRPAPSPAATSGALQPSDWKPPR